jgi:hypothetical protein
MAREGLHIPMIVVGSDFVPGGGSGGALIPHTNLK